jgi:hypothetical protein
MTGAAAFWLCRYESIVWSLNTYAFFMEDLPKGLTSTNIDSIKHKSTLSKGTVPESRRNKQHQTTVAPQISHCDVAVLALRARRVH